MTTRHTLSVQSFTIAEPATATKSWVSAFSSVQFFASHRQTTNRHLQSAARRVFANVLAAFDAEWKQLQVRLARIDKANVFPPKLFLTLDERQRNQHLSCTVKTVNRVWVFVFRRSLERARWRWQPRGFCMVRWSRDSERVDENKYATEPVCASSTHTLFTSRTLIETWPARHSLNDNNGDQVAALPLLLLLLLQSTTNFRLFYLLSHQQQTNALLLWFWLLYIFDIFELRVRAHEHSNLDPNECFCVDWLLKTYQTQ